MFLRPIFLKSFDCTIITKLWNYYCAYRYGFIGIRYYIKIDPQFISYIFSYFVIKNFTIDEVFRRNTHNVIFFVINTEKYTPPFPVL